MWEQHVIEAKQAIKDYRKSLVGLEDHPDSDNKELYAIWHNKYLECYKAADTAYEAQKSLLGYYQDDTDDQSIKDLRFKEWQHIAGLYNRVLKKHDYILINAGVLGDHWYRYHTIYKREEEKKNHVR